MEQTMVGSLAKASSGGTSIPAITTRVMGSDQPRGYCRDARGDRHQ